jgi:hypothetical protein
MAGICSIPLTKKELAVEVNSKSLSVLVYILQIANSLYGLLIAVIGILQRRRLNLDVALWNIKHLTVAPFILAGFMLTNGIANFFYMQNAFIVHTAGGDETPEQAHEHTLSIIILALLVAIGTFAQASVCWANRRVSICFRNCLEIYVFFMLSGNFLFRPAGIS